MKRKQHITAFYLETLLMIVVFISIILVLTRVFGSARVQSVEAKQLTSAVTLAQNTAEAVSASRSPEELLQILNEDGNARIREAGEGTGEGTTLITAIYDADMHPVEIPADSDDPAQLPKIQRGSLLLVETSWSPAQEEERSGLADASIRVSSGSTGETLYTLNTAVFTGETE